MKYLSFDYEKFNEVGLKKVIAEFKKNKLEVLSVEADNKPKRQSGVQTKKAILHFSDGQKLTLQATAQGAIFQVRLNSRVLPVKHVDNLKKAIEEIALKVFANSKQFQRRQAQSATSRISRSDSTVKARTSIKAQAGLLTIESDDLTKAIEVTKEERDEMVKTLESLSQERIDIEEKQNSVSASIDELEREIKSLEQK